MVFASLMLSGFGIYLGRFLRWNSWDLFLRPLDLLLDITHRFADPLAHPRTWGFTLGYGVLLCLLYLMTITPPPEARGRTARARPERGPE